MRLFNKKNKKDEVCDCQTTQSLEDIRDLELQEKIEQLKKEGKMPDVDEDIKVLGSGCGNCELLNKNTIEAVKQLHMINNVKYVTDYKDIARYGVMNLPALVIRDKVVSMGKVLNVNEIVDLIKENYN